MPTLLRQIGETIMNDRWRVRHGLYGAWRVYRGEELIVVFTSWRRALSYARQEAAFDNLSITGIEMNA